MARCRSECAQLLLASAVPSGGAPFAPAACDSARCEVDRASRDVESAVPSRPRETYCDACDAHCSGPPPPAAVRRLRRRLPRRLLHQSCRGPSARRRVHRGGRAPRVPRRVQRLHRLDGRRMRRAPPTRRRCGPRPLCGRRRRASAPAASASARAMRAAAYASAAAAPRPRGGGAPVSICNTAGPPSPAQLRALEARLSWGAGV